MEPITAKELAEVLGVPGRSIGWYGRRGMPHAAHDGRVKLYDVEACRAWLEAHKDDPSIGFESKPPKSKQLSLITDEDDGDSDSPIQIQRKFEKARARKEEAQAALRELELERERRKVVAIEEVERERVARIEAVKGALFTMIARLPGEIEGMAEPEIRVRLEEEVRRCLEAFARGHAS